VASWPVPLGFGIPGNRLELFGYTGSAMGSLTASAVVYRPRLSERSGAAQVHVVPAPAGSGKTVLLRSWIGHAGLTSGAAWSSWGAPYRAERPPSSQPNRRNGDGGI
jgi:hypothetical protein